MESGQASFDKFSAVRLELKDLPDRTPEPLDAINSWSIDILIQDWLRFLSTSNIPPMEENT